MFRVRKLGHVVIKVRDMERSVEFYTEILGFQVSDRNESGLTFLRCGTDHHTLALVPARSEEEMPQQAQQGLHHFAFEVGNVDELLSAREALRTRQVPIHFEGQRGAGMNKSVEFRDPDGYFVELYCDMEQIGWDGESRPSSLWRRSSSLEEAMAREQEEAKGLPQPIRV